MITIDEVLQGFRAQVSKARVHEPVGATWLLDNEENGKSLKIGPLKQQFQARALVLFSAVEEDLMNR